MTRHFVIKVPVTVDDATTERSQERRVVNVSCEVDATALAAGRQFKVSVGESRVVEFVDGEEREVAP